MSYRNHAGHSRGARVRTRSKVVGSSSSGEGVGRGRSRSLRGQQDWLCVQANVFSFLAGFFLVQSLARAYPIVTEQGFLSELSFQITSSEGPASHCHIKYIALYTSPIYRELEPV